MPFAKLNAIAWRKARRQMIENTNFDVIVVGGGHAGCEVEAFCGRERSGSPQPKS